MANTLEYMIFCKKHLCKFFSTCQYVYISEVLLHTSILHKIYLQLESFNFIGLLALT